MIPCLSAEFLVWGNWWTMIPGTHRSTETPCFAPGPSIQPPTSPKETSFLKNYEFKLSWVLAVACRKFDLHCSLRDLGSLTRD